MSVNRRLANTALLGSALAAVMPALAQTPAFPNKPIRIIVPYPAGGATDVSARLVGQRLQEELKQAVVVDNRPGASGNLGMAALLQSPADGYTLAMSLTGMLSINPATYAKAGFTANDVVPIARVMLASCELSSGLTHCASFGRDWQHRADAPSRCHPCRHGGAIRH